MIAYNRVIEFLRELGAECISEFEGPATQFSEWRLGSQTFAVRGEDGLDGSGGGLRLFRMCCQSTAGRPDPIMDALTEMVMKGTPASGRV